MQNPNAKYIKMPNEYFCLFYRENYTLFWRSQTSTGWSVPIILAEHTASAFSVCQFGELCYVLYSTTDGNLFIASSRDFSNWEHRPLMRGTHNSTKTKFVLLPNEDTFHVIYHLPSESPGIETLVYTVYRNGQWEPPYQIDRFMPFGKTNFLVRRISKEHIILYYRTSKNTWSAREMLLSPFTMGSLTPLIQTAANYVDLSIVNDAERIHILYIVRGMFRSQVVYQYKKTTAISTPRILWEDANCDNCLVFLENERLVLMWTDNGQPLRCISENGGTSFGPVERYTGNFPVQCTKGELLGAEGPELNAMETYGDAGKSFIPFLITNKIKTLPQPKTLPPVNENRSQPSFFENQNQPQSPFYEKQNQPQASFSEQQKQTQASFFEQQKQPQASFFENQKQSQSSFFENQNQSQSSFFENQNQPQSSFFEKENWTQTPLYQQREQPQQPSYFAQATKPQSNPMKMGMPNQNIHQQQLEELSALLTQRSDEIASVNARWRAQVAQLEADLAALQQENEKLKKAQSAHQAQTQQPQLHKQEYKIIQAAENNPFQPEEIEPQLSTQADRQADETDPIVE